MVPPPLPLTSPHLRLSPNTYIGDAITTAASPLRTAFNLSCRSPLSPRRHARQSFHSPRSHQLQVPRPWHSPATMTDARWLERKYDGRDSMSSAEDSPTDRTLFLPSTPGIARDERENQEGKLGVVSAVNIIMGKTIGVGAFAVPSAIFAGVGSIGMTLTLWMVGSVIAFCGLAVYMDLGAALPRSGGERVYLERIFRRPRMLGTCMFMAYAVLLGFSTPNAIVLGEHLLYLVGAAPSTLAVRAAATAAVTALCATHALRPRLGVRLIDLLGGAKLVVLFGAVAAGVWGGLAGVGRDPDDRGAFVGATTAQRNFADPWRGTSTTPYDYATALLKVAYCFRGFGAAHAVAGSVRDPARTLRVAAPLALGLVALAYLALNVALFLVVDAERFREAGIGVAATFFETLFGSAGARLLPLCIVVSAAGNIAATSYAQARVNEEFARDRLLPWSGFWSSSSGSGGVQKDRQRQDGGDGGDGGGVEDGGSPRRGLFLHWLVSVLAIVLPPPGRIYNFLIDIGGYPVSVISVAVSLGLLYLHHSPAERWRSPFRAPTFAVVVFALSNVFLLVMPWIPPAGGRGEDGRFVYYAYPATALVVLGAGAGYWCGWRLWGAGRTGGAGQRARGWAREDANVGEMAEASLGLMAKGQPPVGCITESVR